MRVKSAFTTKYCFALFLKYFVPFGKKRAYKKMFGRVGALSSTPGNPLATAFGRKVGAHTVMFYGMASVGDTSLFTFR